jgi:DNA-binding SARP family transcriptional activator
MVASGRELPVNRPFARSGPRAPVTLRTLGGLDIAGLAGNAVSDLLSRPKPLAVLLYLALADPALRQRRDTLLFLFWPDADAERARSSLRQAVYQLRRGLGSEIIGGRGDDVALNANAITCDAALFERRLALGDLAGALELYRGDLLPGFFVEGAPAFENWLDAVRRRFRTAASSAARTLAAAAEESGDAGAALEWSRRAVAIAAEDEASVRRLIAGLDRAGDRTGALRVFEDLASLLRTQYGLEPTAETMALVAAMRADSDVAPASVALDPRRILVTVFENDTGNVALDPFGRLVADCVAQGVAQLDGVQVVPLTASLVASRNVGLIGAEVSSAEHARRIAEDMQAGTVVTGAYYVAGNELVLQGWLGDARTGSVLHALGPVRAPIASPMPAVDALRSETCTRLARQLETRVTHVRAAGRIPTYEAHTEYVEGLVRFVDGDWPGALHHLERAVAADAEYALPLIVAAIARWNLGELDAAERAVKRAVPIVRSAGPFERALLDMVRAWLAGDWAAAWDAVRRQAELAPGSIASFQVAEEARRRNRPREALRQLATLDPARGEMRGWIFYWVVQAQALHMLGEHARELECARRARSLYPEASMALRLEIHARAALGDVGGLRSCIDESLASPARHEPRAGVLMREAAFELCAHGHGGEAANALLRECLTWYLHLPAEEQARPAVRRAAARARYDAGDWDGATRDFTSLAGEVVRLTDCASIHHPHLQAHLDHGYLGVLAVRRSDDADAARIDALLEHTREKQMFGSTYYWRASMAALRDDAEAAARLLRRAFADGLPYEPFIHADPHFALIRGTPVFAALLGPRA